MYISEKNKVLIKKKFDGKCAYSGTVLLDNWQVDHVKPFVRNWWNNTAVSPENNVLENMYPVQKLINHYKGSLDLETFRNWYLKGLHLRLQKLPKNPTAIKTIKRKAYLLQIAEFFDITTTKPFEGVFYFEKIETQNHTKG